MDRLVGLESTEVLAVGQIADAFASSERTYCVRFLNWNSVPISRPSITNYNGTQTIEWTLFTNGDPQLGAIATIRPLREPAAVALTTVALSRGSTSFLQKSSKQSSFFCEGEEVAATTREDSGRFG